MPKVGEPIGRLALLRKLGKVYDELCEKHSVEMRAIGNTNERIPVGGDGWMDLFFKMEGVRGAITALRAGKPVEEAIEFGKSTATIAVKLWNGKREYQVQRWEQTADNFVEYTVRSALRA